jgi:hypothetical protein
MSEMLKCDRCGKVDDLPIYSFGTEQFYLGAIKKYTYLGQEIEPEITEIDLCNRCKNTLHIFVNEFMEKTDETI